MRCFVWEALVITNKKLARKFRTYMKQNGAVMAKGWLLGMQFCSLLEDDAYEKMTAQADAYALEIKAALKKKGSGNMWTAIPTSCL